MRAIPTGLPLAAAAAVAILGLGLLGLGRAGASGPLDPPSADRLVVTEIPDLAEAQPVTLIRTSGSGVPQGAPWRLPTVAAGNDEPFTLQGDSNAVGALARSADGRYVTLAGYTQAVGGNPEDSTPRDVARVDSIGRIDTSTTLSTYFTQAKIRGAVSNDGSAFWVTGNGNTTAPLGGMVYAPLGSETPTRIFERNTGAANNKAFNNTRTVQIAGGDLYFGSEKGTAGIYRTTGLPTAEQLPTQVVAFGVDGQGPISELPLKHEPSAAVDTLYVVQEGVGIFKFSLQSGSWVARGELLAGEFAGIAGRVDSEGHFRLYAITETPGDAENSIVLVTDTAAFDATPVASGPTTVLTAPAGTAFRGVSLAPEDPSLELAGAPTAVGGTPEDGTVDLSWSAPASNGGSPIVAYRITPFVAGAPQTPVTTPSASTDYHVGGLANGIAYTFEVEAINGTGPGPASEPSAPIAPVGTPNPTIALAAPALEGSIGDPTNPADAVTVEQAGTPPAGLTVEATASSNPGVAALAGVTVDGVGATRTVSVAPAGGVGYADITLKVTGAGAKSATTTLHYAASASPTTTSRWLTGSSDDSTAVDAGGGYFLVADDQENTLRLYRGDASGAPLKSWSFDAQMGSPEEINIEAAVRAGNTIYWTGSMSNSKSGNPKPDRSILFTTAVSGAGAATELTFGGYYRGLRADLIAWDEANGNRFGFAAGTAAGQVPKQVGGFSVEGLEFAPGSSSTAYLAFRAPLVPAAAGGKALLVPVTNFSSLAAGPGQNTAVHASFGAPVLLDLGGLSVRELRRNAADEYLILAGSWASGGSYALFGWDGVPGHAPVRSTTPLPAGDPSGEEAAAWEGIVSVPRPLTSSSQVRLVSDNGSSDLYGDGLEAKSLAFDEWKKSRTDLFAYTPPAAGSSGGGVGSGGSSSPPPAAPGPRHHRHRAHRKRAHRHHHRCRRRKGHHRRKHRCAKGHGHRR